jgi:hypothetical protein
LRGGKLSGSGEVVGKVEGGAFVVGVDLGGDLKLNKGVFGVSLARRTEPRAP